MEKDDIREIRRWSCRNPWKQNVILRAKPEIFRRIMKLGRVNIGVDMIFAEEYMDLLICFRCWRFSHTQKSCNNEELCGTCSGMHDHRECGSKEQICVNCYRANKKEGLGHRPNSWECPVYKKAAERARNNIIQYYE